MKGSVTKRPKFHQAPRHVWKMRKATGERLSVILQEGRGDPRLTAWEEGFLASMADIQRRTGGQPELSEKQAKVLLSIEDKLRLPAPDPEEQEPTC